MQIRIKGGVKRLITKLINIFLCNGSRRWPNQCLSLVMRILCPRHWVRLVWGLPSTPLSLVGRTGGEKQTIFRCGFSVHGGGWWASGQLISALGLHFHFRKWPPCPLEAQFSLFGWVNQFLYFLSFAFQPQAETKQLKGWILALTWKLKILWKSPCKMEE